MGLWSWLTGTFTKKHVASEKAFQGVLKYNTVFVTDESLEKLTVRGFGARRLRQVLYYTQSYSDMSKTPNKEGVEDTNESGENILAAEMSPAITSRRVDIENDKSPMILFDEEAFFLFKLKILELQHEDGTTVTLQELWEKFCEKNQKFPLKYKVYSHFREQDFVVKTGVHYGLDYAVYRTLPSHCHSEMCALVVDGTQKVDISEGLESAASTSQISWRHVSTMTRVMPDVMKLLVICHVLPAGLNSLESDTAEPMTNGAILGDIFESEGKGNSQAEEIDCSTPDCLNNLKVYPQTCLVRRLPCKGEAYDSIGDVQQKYRSCSILKKPRLEQVTKKKRRKRRDHMEVRVKAASKHNRLWKQIMDTTTRQRRGGRTGNEDEGEESYLPVPSKSAQKKAEKLARMERKEKTKAQEEAKSKNLAAASAALAAARGDPTDIIAMMNAKLAKAKETPAAPGVSAAAAPAPAPTPAPPSSTPPSPSPSKKRRASSSSGPAAEEESRDQETPARVSRRKTSNSPEGTVEAAAPLRRSGRIRSSG